MTAAHAIAKIAIPALAVASDEQPPLLFFTNLAYNVTLPCASSAVTFDSSLKSADVYQPAKV